MGGQRAQTAHSLFMAERLHLPLFILGTSERCKKKGKKKERNWLNKVHM